MNELCNENDSFSIFRKQGKSRWGNLPIDYSKCKHESLKTDSSSTSHLVESVDTNSIQVPSAIVNRSSPITTTSSHSSYRQAPLTSVSLSYRQASALPGFHTSNPTRSFSPEHDDIDEGSSNMNPMPLINNRPRTNTTYGSHKSLSESLQSLRSNRQTPVSLPVKKSSNDAPPPILPKREQRSSSPNSSLAKNDYQHHYHNPGQLQVKMSTKSENTSSEDDEEFQSQTINPMIEHLSVIVVVLLIDS